MPVLATVKKLSCFQALIGFIKEMKANNKLLQQWPGEQKQRQMKAKLQLQVIEKIVKSLMLIVWDDILPWVDKEDPSLDQTWICVVAKKTLLIFL